MNKISKIFVVFLVILLYFFRIYWINKDAPNLRDFTKEVVGEEFDAFGGYILVESVKIIDVKSKDGNEEGKTNKYIEIIYKIRNINNPELMDIRGNYNGYIFFDGLQFPENIGENKYKYLIPLLVEHELSHLKVFFENTKFNELEHHYIDIID